MINGRTSRLGVALLVSMLLAACGGGSGGGGQTLPGGGGDTNQPPIVKIDVPEGEQMELSLVTLSASGSSDPDGDDLIYAWEQISGPEVSWIKDDTPSVQLRLPKVRNQETVEYVFELTVSDGENEVVETIEFSPTVYQANGVLFAAVQDKSNVEKLYFDHPAFGQPVVLDQVEDLAESEGVLYSLVGTTHDDLEAIVAREIYSTDSDVGATQRLLRVSLDGSGASDITGPVTVDEPYIPLNDVVLSPDRKWIVFKGILEQENVTELFVVPVDSADGSDRVKVSGEITATDSEGAISGKVRYKPKWSPDSAQVLFAGDLRTRFQTEIFAADIVTGERRVMSREPSTATEVFFNVADPTSDAPFDWSPDGEYVAMLQQNADLTRAIDVVRADNSERVTVADVIEPYPNSKLAFRWSSSGALAFHADTVPVGEELTLELFIYTPGANDSGPFAVGGSSLHDDNTDGLPDARVFDFTWSPDGEHLAFRLRRVNPLRYSNYIVPRDATSSAARIRIDEGRDDVTGGIGVTNSWLPDSNGLVLQRAMDFRELYRNSISGDDFRKISGLIETDGIGVGTHRLSPSGQSIAYTVSSIGNAMELRISSTEGEDIRVISGTNTASDGDDSNGTIDGRVSLSDSPFSPDESQLLFRGDLEIHRLNELYAVPTNSNDGSDRRKITSLLSQDNDDDGRPDGYFSFAWWVGPDLQ